ncbi:butyrophilin subfamily 1 member A1-like [Dicentrarchus labrax]|uniref:butyrophilin subfamily 1 member A1-like n=1 Tax=Dicentrarchus labrax TaxID=13489 RepID=UPI0021F5EAB4|nr:butyrophilin subfamily 1 member A1-like [Dicentrarchus labrax]
MLCLKDELFVKVFQHIVVVLLTHCCGGQSLVGGPPPPVAALVGEDILLPCRLDPAADAVSMIIEWGRPNLKPRFVHVWHEGQDLLVNQNPSYKGRTSLSTDKLKHGDLSLRLSKVKVSDGGTYRCFIPKLSRESTVQLIVGSVSSPVITGINISSNAGVLQCESKGWYPEPEVVWLDGEGNLLSAGPTETVRGPDDLYTVSSRVTVEKRHSNNFTCRVQQKDINHASETCVRSTVNPDYFHLNTGTVVHIIRLR